MHPTHHSSLDPRFAQAEVCKQLHDLLHLTRTNRDVADWLYTDSPESQRCDGILSPDMFSRSTGTSTLQSYTDLSVRLNPSQESTVSEYSEVFIHDLYVPVKHSNGIALGYSFHSASPKFGSSIVLRDIFKGMKTKRARYAYKKDDRLLLTLMRNTKETDLILYIEWTSDSQRQVQYFQIPHRQYAFDDHPKTVILSARAYADVLCLHSPRKPHDTSASIPVLDISGGEEALPNGPADFVDGDWRVDNINSLPECVFQDLHNRSDGENRCYRESSAWLKAKQVRLLSGRYTNGLIQFGKRRKRFAEGGDTPDCLMNGNFFSAHVVRGLFDESGALSKRWAFEASTRTTPPDPASLELVRKASSNLYYSTVLWASTDQCLVTAQEQSAAELLWGKDTKGEDVE